MTWVQKIALIARVLGGSMPDPPPKTSDEDKEEERRALYEVAG